MPNYVCVVEMYVGEYGFHNEWRITAPDFATAKQAGLYICAYHKTVHLSVVEIRAVHVAASPNVTRQEFVDVPYGENGDVAVSTPDVPDPELCVFIELAPDMGYPGKKFLRYAHSQQEAHGAGKNSIWTSGAAPARFDAAAASLITVANNTFFSICIGKNFRLANTIVASGFAHQDTDHAWFNKKNNTPITV